MLKIVILWRLTTRLQNTSRPMFGYDVKELLTISLLWCKVIVQFFWEMPHTHNKYTWAIPLDSVHTTHLTLHIIQAMFIFWLFSYRQFHLCKICLGSNNKKNSNVCNLCEYQQALVSSKKKNGRQKRKTEKKINPKTLKLWHVNRIKVIIVLFVKCALNSSSQAILI